MVDARDRHGAAAALDDVALARYVIGGALARQVDKRILEAVALDQQLGAANTEAIDYSLRSAARPMVVELCGWPIQEARVIDRRHPAASLAHKPSRFAPQGA